jgi:hypothetical protein
VKTDSLILGKFYFFSNFTHLIYKKNNEQMRFRYLTQQLGLVFIQKFILLR